MRYYKVKASKDQKPIYSKQGKYKGFLIGNELYTGNELMKLVKDTGIDFNKFIADCFYPVEISKKSVYWFFGARFEKREG